MSPQLAVSPQRLHMPLDGSQPKKGSSFNAKLASYNPWLWLKLNDTSAPLGDSASKCQLGPGFGSWGGTSGGCAGGGTGFPGYPPLHPRSMSGGNAYPVASSGAGNTYGVAGATTDGATGLQFAGAETYPATWANLDNFPVLNSSPASILYFFKKSGTAGGGWVWSATCALGYFGIAWDGTNLLAFMRDSSDRFFSGSWVNPGGVDDGNWHLIGLNISGSLTTLVFDLFVDGVHVSAVTLTASASNYSPYATLTTGIDVGGGNARDAGPTSFNMQHFAIFPTGTVACNELLLADYAALYAAR